MSYAHYLPQEITRAFAAHSPDRYGKLLESIRAELAQPQDDALACGHIKALLDAQAAGDAARRAAYDIDLSEEAME